MTMMPRHALLLAVLLALAGPVSGATAREVSASELRKIVSAGGMLSLKAVVASVASSTGAEPIEARAFELDDIYYRVVLKRANGSLISVVINAQTGEQVGANSSVGRQVREAATQTDGKAKKGKSATAGGNGNGNVGGNGNAGGNGNGNGGGNGNGNGGGNGNGNGGGNGGGKG